MAVPTQVPVTILKVNAVGNMKEEFLGAVADAATPTVGWCQTGLSVVESVTAQTSAWLSTQTSVAKQGIRIGRNTDDIAAGEDLTGKWGKFYFTGSALSAGDPLIFHVRGR